MEFPKPHLREVSWPLLVLLRSRLALGQLRICVHSKKVVLVLGAICVAEEGLLRQ